MSVYPRRDVLTFEQTSNVAANAKITGSDFDTVEGTPDLESNEIFEVERIEIIPPYSSDGSLQTFKHIRLNDGEENYPHVYYRNFMLGWLGPAFGLRTPKFGQPVLENKVNPMSRPILTACPKFGPTDSVYVSLQNDGTAITGSFTVRVIGWRFEGSENELNQYFSAASNLTPHIDQTISLSNPFLGEGNVYASEPVNIVKGADGGAHGQFTRLTGGINQSFPKVYPWATWAENATATQPNKDYDLRYPNGNVSDKYQRMYFDFSGGNNAAMINYIMVQDDVANLDTLKMALSSRSSDDTPEFNVEPNDQHELPFVRRLDGTVPNIEQVESVIGGSLSRPVSAVDRIPARVTDQLQPAETVVWEDEGGIVINDDGTAVSANAVKLAVQGYRMELKG